MPDGIGNWGCEASEIELKRSHFINDAVMKQCWLFLLLCPCLPNRDFDFNGNSGKISFTRFDHCPFQNCSGIICQPIRNFENNFIMDRPYDPSSHTQQSLWKQAQCPLCDICGCLLDGCVVEVRSELAKPVSLACLLLLQLENYDVLRVLGLFKEFLRGGIRAENAV